MSSSGGGGGSKDSDAAPKIPKPSTEEDGAAAAAASAAAPAVDTDPKKNVTFVSSDGKKFVVSQPVAFMSELVKTIVGGQKADDDASGSEDDDASGSEDEDENDQEIPLPNVKAAILAYIIEFCKHVVEANDYKPPPKPLTTNKISDLTSEWYAKFMTQFDHETLFEIILGANFMNIKPLLDLSCATVASMIKGKTPEEIRTTFNIVNDFSPEEEKKIREENKWCEES